MFALQFPSDLFLRSLTLSFSLLRSDAGNCSGVGSGREDCMEVLSRPPRERHGFDHRGVANDNSAAGGTRDVAPGERWAFVEHRTMADVIAAEGDR
jgi:hypothetical protein